MRKKTRIILFTACLFLFAILAPLIVFYSQGYRLNLSGEKKITKTGGIFLKTNPKQVEIFLDGKLKKRTDFFFGSSLLENLLPKNYNVEVKKNGYFSWQKSLTVKEKEVTDIKNIILFPKNLNFKTLIKTTENFWFSNNNKDLILKEENENSWSLKLYDLDTDIKSHLLFETDIYPQGADLLSLEFSKENSKIIFLKIKAREKLHYFTLAIDKIPPILKEKAAPLPLPKNQVAFENFNKILYYLDDSGNLFANEKKISTEKFPIKSGANYALKKFQNFIFLQENQSLYQFNNEKKLFIKYFDEIKELKISPDKKELAIFSKHEIWVLFLEDKLNQPIKKTGDKILIVRLSEEINNFFWLNSDYLIFNTNQAIKIAEIDDRDQINIVEFNQQFKDLKIIWNSLSKKIYLYQEETLYVSEPLF